ncbi:MAG: hypothetical protein H6746_04930 [Deltaproteobacteria bacterium]|nr:hypothetical protein [Deltaproteobacteria bacterium]
MRPLSCLLPALALAALSTLSCTGGERSPVTVPPADAPGADERAGPEDSTALPEATPADGHPADRWQPGTGGTGGGLFVVDAQGTDLGLLIRRGSDDSVAGRTIYDTVTVFHPGSGLFFDITMTDATPLLPGTTFFTSSDCATPVGVSAGGCATCLAGHGIGFLHGGAWWRVVAGAAREAIANGSARGPTADAACVPHSSSNSPAFPVEPVSGPHPPTAFVPPLRFAYR